MMNTNFLSHYPYPARIRPIHFSSHSATATSSTKPELQLLLTLNPSSDQELESQLQKIANDATIANEELLPVLKELWGKTSGSSLRVEIIQVLRDRKIPIPVEFLEKSLPSIVETPGPQGALL